MVSLDGRGSPPGRRQKVWCRHVPGYSASDGVPLSQGQATARSQVPCRQPAGHIQRRNVGRRGGRLRLLRAWEHHERVRPLFNLKVWGSVQRAACGITGSRTPQSRPARLGWWGPVVRSAPRRRLQRERGRLRRRAPTRARRRRPPSGGELQAVARGLLVLGKRRVVRVREHLLQGHACFCAPGSEPRGDLVSVREDARNGCRRSLLHAAVGLSNVRACGWRGTRRTGRGVRAVR